MWFSQDTRNSPGRLATTSSDRSETAAGVKPLLLLKGQTPAAHPTPQPLSKTLSSRLFFQPLLLSLQPHAAVAMTKSSCWASLLNGVRGFEIDDGRGF